MNLHRLQGPSCPDCGCHDSTAGRVFTRWWGQPRRNRRCNHCGCRFVEIVEREGPAEQDSNGHAAEEEKAEPGAVIFHVVHCPECGSDHQRVTRTLRPIRYHKCRECEHKFKSVEKKA